jgi:hypothetical protein
MGSRRTYRTLCSAASLATIRSTWAGFGRPFSRGSVGLDELGAGERGAMTGPGILPLVHAIQVLLLAGDREQRTALAAVGARLVPVGGGLMLVPLTSPLLVHVESQYPGRDVGPSRTCRMLTGALARFARRLSSTGPVAYIETDYFGGHGDQAATVFLRGQRVLRRPRAAIGPINDALALLGVATSPLGDAFDTVGLGRYRQTGSWLAEAIEP